MIPERHDAAVFPAYAGMSPIGWGIKWAVEGFPRLRGDEPLLFALRQALKEFSPPTRG